MSRLKNMIRPYYHPVRNVVRKFWITMKARVGQFFLHKAYREELSFFENVRSRVYKDREYKAKRIRMLAHWVDKALTLSEKPDKTTTVKQVRSLMADYDQQDAGSVSTAEWVNEVLSFQEKAQKPAAIPPQMPDGAASVLGHIIETRRSIRSYKTQKIEDEVLNTILTAGQWAPTGCNRQAIEYLIVNDPEDVLFCQKYAGEYYTFPREAYVNIVVLVDPRGYSLPRQRHMAYLESGAAIQNILLTAHSHGIGSCWMFWAKFDESFNKRFHLAPWLLPVSLLCLGYTNQHPPIVPGRKRISDSIHDLRADDQARCDEAV